MSTHSPNATLAARFANKRAGQDLVAVVDAGLPIARIAVDVDAQERKDLPALDEFTLRLAAAHITAPSDMAGLLGLELPDVHHSLAEALTREYLVLTAPSKADGTEADEQRVRLTARGAKVAEEHAAIQPTREKLRLLWDQLLRTVRPHDLNDLRTTKQAEEEGLLLLPASSVDPVQPHDLAVAEINAIEGARPDARYQVLAVRRVTQRPGARYLPVKLLVYADPERTEVELGVVVDGELSPAHELALLNQGGAKALGISVASPQKRPALDDALERLRVPLEELAHAHATSRSQDPETPDEPAIEVRAISVFEHADLLEEALTQSKERILLIAPWIKRSIVTADFLAKLDSRLRSGVTVTIAHGYGPNDTKSDRSAIDRLQRLAARHPDKFGFVELKSTHAKVLIMDDRWVTTSFNWLSFRGDPDRTYRMEEGTLVQHRATVDTQYERYLQMINDQRAD